MDKKEKKEKKSERLRAWKAYYKALPFYVKVWHGITNLVVLGVLITALVFAQAQIRYAIAENASNPDAALEAAMIKAQDNPADDEAISAFITSADSSRVDAMPHYGKDDTWAFYIYMCGSNLESSDVNELSEMTQYLLSKPAAESKANYNERILSFLDTYVQEINSQDMDLPDYMYLPTDNTPAEEETDEDPAVYYGAASEDIDEMMEVTLPKNVEIIIQAGGSPRWSNSLINPNRLNRLRYDSEGLHVEEQNQIQNMGSAETLADFLTYCEKNHPADHKVVLFWNHGSGMLGFCQDDNYNNDGIELPEMREALAAVYGKDPKEIPLEMIGFDACLMAGLENAEYMHGYTRYLVASEEVEAGNGWDYTGWLSSFVEDTSVNGAQLGMEIIDTFNAYYANTNVYTDPIGVQTAATLSVIDVEKAHDLYEAYTDLAEAALKRTVQEPATVTILGRAARESIAYANHDRSLNTIDLGLFLENLQEDFPNETHQALLALDETVLYSRNSINMQGSTGISVYFPAYMDGFNGLILFLFYENIICEDPALQALYYYKVSGCLNEELQAYVQAQGYGAMPKLDVKALNTISDSDVDILNDGNYCVSISKDALQLTESMNMTLARYEEESGDVTYYGAENTLVQTNEDGTITTCFDGSWITMNGQPLAIEPVSKTHTADKYRSHVKINDADYYLLLQYDRENDNYDLIGTSKMSDSDDIVGRAEFALKSGDRITPVYEISNLNDTNNTNVKSEIDGTSFTYNEKNTLEHTAVEDGEYFSIVTAVDTRGDEYYAAVMQFTVRSGKIVDTKSTDRIAQRDY